MSSPARAHTALHWNGTAWRRVPSPSPVLASVLERVTVISATDAWAVGSSGRRVLIEHWNGRAWRRTPAPAAAARAALIGVSGTSARNVWAVGVTGTTLAAGPALAARPAATPATPAAAATAPLILHWNGRAWTRASVPVPASGGELIGVHAVSGRSAWAVGCTRTFTAIRARPLVLRWNGAAWK